MPSSHDLPEEVVSRITQYPLPRSRRAPERASANLHLQPALANFRRASDGMPNLSPAVRAQLEKLAAGGSSGGSQRSSLKHLHKEVQQLQKQCSTPVDARLQQHQHQLHQEKMQQVTASDLSVASSDSAQYSSTPSTPDVSYSPSPLQGAAYQFLPYSPPYSPSLSRRSNMFEPTSPSVDSNSPYPNFVPPEYPPAFNKHRRTSLPTTSGPLLMSNTRRKSLPMSDSLMPNPASLLTQLSPSMSSQTSSLSSQSSLPPPRESYVSPNPRRRSSLPHNTLMFQTPPIQNFVSDKSEVFEQPKKSEFLAPPESFVPQYEDISPATSPPPSPAPRKASFAERFEALIQSDERDRVASIPVTSMNYQYSTESHANPIFQDTNMSQHLPGLPQRPVMQPPMLRQPTSPIYTEAIPYYQMPFGLYQTPLQPLASSFYQPQPPTNVIDTTIIDNPPTQTTLGNTQHSTLYYPLHTTDDEHQHQSTKLISGSLMQSQCIDSTNISAVMSVNAATHPNPNSDGRTSPHSQASYMSTVSEQHHQCIAENAVSCVSRLCNGPCRFATHYTMNPIQPIATNLLHTHNSTNHSVKAFISQYLCEEMCLCKLGSQI